MQQGINLISPPTKICARTTKDGVSDYITLCKGDSLDMRHIYLVLAPVAIPAHVGLPPRPA